MLAEQYSQAQSWLDIGLPRNSEGLWARNLFQFADWLDPKALPQSPGDATTPKDLVADVKDGLPPTQTTYALALHFGLLSGQEQTETTTRVLRELVAQNDYLVGTRFAGTPCLWFALHNINATEDVCRMLLQIQLPSWLYQVVQGGTTTWERWDSLIPEGTVNPGEMTSFNHYAFGSVADWMHQVIGGIAPLEPGWRKFLIAPVPGGDSTSAEIRFVSQYGEIHVEWWLELKDKNAASPSHTLQLRALIPPNSRASARVPGSQETFEVGSGGFEYRGPYYHLSRLKTGRLGDL
ncbi:Alpha-L-rhamnosidase [Fusarium keratoplasticum]|nr:Alpha-L-rhamnosidase [Fusarium keratoplasticum]